MAQVQIHSNKDIIDSFINVLLEKCVAKKTVVGFDDDLYFTTNDASQYDNLLLKEQFIESKINKYKQEMRKARKLLSEYRKGKNLKSHLPSALKTQVIYQIPPTALLKIFDKCFSDNVSISNLVDQVNLMCKRIKTDQIEVSDTEEKIFDSDEEALFESLSSKKRKSQARVKRTKRQRVVSDSKDVVPVKEDLHRLASDLLLSEDEN